jgi:hypothetical protein
MNEEELKLHRTEINWNLYSQNAIDCRVAREIGTKEEESETCMHLDHPQCIETCLILKP